jgi:hypothetical protein
VDTTWTPRWTPKPRTQRQDKVYQNRPRFGVHVSRFTEQKRFMSLESRPNRSLICFGAKSGGTDGPFKRPEALLVIVIESLTCPRFLPDLTATSAQTRQTSSVLPSLPLDSRGLEQSFVLNLPATSGIEQHIRGREIELRCRRYPGLVHGQASAKTWSHSMRQHYLLCTH